MNPVRFPALITRLYPRRLWRMPAGEKVLYLTFDDGPTPDITGQVLDELKKFGARATFFMVGDKVQARVELVRRIRKEGHTIGNHTQHHLKGWKTPPAEYLADVELASQSLRAVLGYEPRLFRPPYGKAGRRSARRLLDRYRIVMWDVMPGDFLPSRNAGDVTRKVILKSRPGSVIVLHDSEKCGRKMLHALPQILDYFRGKGYRFEALPDPALTP